MSLPQWNWGSSLILALLAKNDFVRGGGWLLGRSELSKKCLDILAIVFLFNICSYMFI